MADLNGLMELLQKAGLSLKSLLGLFTGKLKSEEKKKVIFTVLYKIEPGLTIALDHLEQAHQKKAFIVLDKRKQAGSEDKYITVVSICTKNENGSLRTIEQIHFPEVGGKVVDILEKIKTETPDSNETSNTSTK